VLKGDKLVTPFSNAINIASDSPEKFNELFLRRFYSLFTSP